MDYLKKPEASKEIFNILDVVRNKVFLDKLYPNGIFNYFIGQVNLGLSSFISITLHVKDKPNIEVSKWGKWGINYNIITIELSSNLAHHIEVSNWENSENSICRNEITKQVIGNEEITNMKFFNDDWHIEIKTTFGLLYQKSSVYILGDLI
jgi:hypothetical protein